jgi:predicted Zn finger-like uncharacterized protein
MDVICERCSTEYEFDDALVSEQGTPVKCTNCGHQFKVFRTPDSAAPEQWIVRTMDGRQLEFRALRELREAIAEGRVERDDVLTTGNARPRRLGAIAELEPFFVRGGMTMPGFGTPPPRARSRTPQGLGVMPPPSRTESPRPEAIPSDLRTTALYSSATPAASLQASVPAASPGASSPIPSPRPSTPTPVAPAAMPTDLRTTALYSSEPGAHPARAAPLPVPVVTPAPVAPVASDAPAAARPPAAHAPAPLATQVSDDLSGLSNSASHADAARTPVPDDTSSRPAASSAAGIPTTGDLAPISSPRPLRGPARGAELTSQDPLATPMSDDLQSLQSLHSLRGVDDAYDEPRFSIVPSKRAGPTRWILGFFLGGMLLFAALAVGRKYLPTSGQPGTAATDERTSALLRDGERSMLDGDLDGAKEHFIKAGALAEKDARVASSMAYLAVVSADIPWLRARLIAPDDPDRDTANKALALAVDQAQKAASRAQELAPADPMVTRCRIDALRIAGDRDGARRLVDGIASASGQPDNAFVLAALELAEDKPSWQTVIERLRVAASAEQSLGRARSMLIYALARSGDAKAAKAELDKLAAFARPHPLTSALRAFLTRSDAAQEKAPDPSSADAGADVSEAIRLGNEARKKGQLVEAEELLQGALQKKPGDPEILTAIAELARAKGNHVEAAKLFDQALGSERAYPPALAGLADLKWELGDRPAAVTLYKRLLEKGGDKGPFAARAKARIEKGRSAPVEDDGRVPDDYVAPESLVGKPPDQGGTPPPSTAAPSHPEIDTSDLPGYNKP